MNTVMDGKRKLQPYGTKTYTVLENDSLVSIAAQFNSTVSELKAANRLMSSAIFPGQVIYVYDNTNLLQSDEQSSWFVDTHSNASSFSSCSSYGRHGSVSSRRTDELPDESKVREEFFKVNGAKYITDGQGIVNGTLLITYNSAMFDPSVSDPLIVERGPDDYHVAVPIDSIMQMTIYEDIAAKAFSWGSGLPPPKIYHGSDPSLDASGHHSISESVNLDCSANINCHNFHLSSSESDMASDSAVTEFPRSSSNAEMTTESQSVSDSTQCAVSHTVTVGAEAGLQGCDINRLKQDVGVDCQQTQMTGNISSPKEADEIEETCDNLRNVVIVSTQSQTLGSVISKPSVGDTESELAQMSGEDAGVDSSLSLDRTCTQRTEKLSGNAVSCALSNISPGRLFQMDDVTASPKNLMTIHEDWHKSVQFAPGEPAHQDSVEPSNVLYSSVGIPTSWSNRVRSIVSLPRFTPCGSFILPPDEDVFVDLSCGLFSMDPADMGRVQDVSLLAPPPPTLFLIGEDEPLILEPEHSSAAECTQSNTLPGGNTDVVKNGAESSEVKQPLSAGSEQKVRMRDATPKEVLNDIFSRTSTHELTAKPAVRCEDMPKYLCLRIGRPLAGHRHVSSPIESYKLSRMKPEYWFSIPIDRVAPLHRFILQRLPPRIYGSDDEIDPAGRGFEVLSREDLRSLIDVECVTGSTKRSSLKLSLSDAELENLPLPELSEPSEILTSAHLRQLRRHLPAIAEGCKWHLCYSSERNGYSIRTMFRNLRNISSPVILIIKNSIHEVFGAMLSNTLYLSESFYGNGETYLFTFHPFFKKFGWSGENRFFIKCSEDGICIGCSSGTFGLWLDGELWHGRSRPCATFKNDVLGSQEDFFIRVIEIWSFAIAD